MLKNIFGKPYIKIAVTLYFSSLLSALANSAEVNKSMSYTLSVTIPPHVVIPKNETTVQAQNKTENSSQSKDQETVKEKTLRDNQPVILETTTAK